MPGSAKALSFRSLRPWEGSQDRAFEELSYQLLKEDAPDGSTVVRTGNPDGGVEWYADLPNGDQWGWQAKNVQGIDALLTAMTKSVEQVAAERKRLVRLTFVVSTNLATGTSRNNRKSQRQKYDDKINAWKKSITGADRISFDLVQESDLLDRLSQPEHRGRQWFWWTRPTFGDGWLEAFYEQQAEVAGDKYRPDLNVDLPISEDLKGLGLSQPLMAEFTALRKRLVKASQGLGEIDALDAELDDAGREMRDATCKVVEDLGKDDPFSFAMERFDALERSLTTALATTEVVRSLCFQRRSSLEAGREDEGQLDRAVRDRLNDILYRCQSIRDPESELQQWLQKSSTRAARSRLYFLVGSAGSGKTHLLLDSVRTALDEGRPAVFLHGAQFGGDLWANICNQLGLEPLGRDVLLGAMDSAAEASGNDGGRFVIMVDALSETPVGSFWQVHLPVIRSAISQWPNLALAVSCRDAYVEVIDPDKLREQFVEVAHPGFTGREIEATQRYFDHFGLEAPRIPLLTPEFSVPLFLRLYCESLRDGGMANAAVGHEGRVEIFVRYLDSKVDRVARRAFPGASSNLEIGRNRRRVQESVDALLDEMASSEYEWLDGQRAEAAVAAALKGDHVLAAAIIGGLEYEGVLSQEPLYLLRAEGGVNLRITFQAFSDFLLLKRQLDRFAAPLQSQEFKGWLRDKASWGVLEAATVVLPELHGIELPDFLDLGASDIEWKADGDTEVWRRRGRAQHIFRSLVEMLPYRASTSITSRTTDLLNVVLQSNDIRVDFFDILFTIAPQPDNLLNADGMHRYLARQSMPARDASFGFDVYYDIWEESSPATRLARWAALGPYPSYPSSVIELAAIPLFWLLSSPNRFMRDWVTKVLVQLLHGHLDVMTALFERFWTINDPYVVQRVTAVAYGCLMRGGVLNPVGAKQLATSVLERVFARPMRADELLLDAARGVVDWGVNFGVLSKTALEETKRPYGFKTLGSPLSKEHLNAKYADPSGERKRDSESYETVWSSLFVMDDFGRYVVDSTMHHFSRYRIGQTVPEREPEKPRLIKSRLAKFVKALDETQRAEWEQSLSVGSPSLRFLLRYGDDESTPYRLSKEQWELFEASWAPERPIPAVNFPGELARRWVFQRTLSLGWTPHRFGETDWFISRRGPGRNSDKAERWGKKYQWMAFHELLARVADNHQVVEYGGESEHYDGLQQLMGRREIDPSLPPVSYRDFESRRGEGASTWPPSPIDLGVSLSPRIAFARYRRSAERFIADHGTEPQAANLVQIPDDSGVPWIALAGSEVQQESVDDNHIRKLEQTLVLRSVFVPEQDAVRTADELTQAWQERSSGFDQHGHVDCCYTGEIGWSTRSCPYRADGVGQVNHDRFSIPIITPVEDYTWENGLFDCSIGVTVRATMLSTYMRARTKVSMITAGPSSVDQLGQVVATFRESEPYRGYGDYWYGVYARKDWLEGFLSQEGLALVLVGRFERRLLDGHKTYDHPHLEVWSSAVLARKDGVVAAGKAIRSQGPRPG